MRTFLDYLYPPRCPICDDVRPVDAPVCHPDCRDKLLYVGNVTCLRCGKPVSDPGREYCYDCAEKPRAFSGGVSTFIYEDAIRDSMLRFKYHSRAEYAEWYANELFRQNASKLRAFGAKLIVPVPLHRERYRKRGYNQAALIANELGRLLGVPAEENYLERRKQTTAQKKLDDIERARNLLKAFALTRRAKKRMTPKRVILVDDIYTTGSTLDACTRVLLHAGVEQVMVATICIGSGYS